MNLVSALYCLLISVYLLVGQPSVLVTDNLKMSLCDFSISHSYSKWSVVWSFLPHGHVGVAAILNRYRYALMFPCPVTMVVNFGLVDIFMFKNLVLGKDE